MSGSGSTTPSPHPVAPLRSRDPREIADDTALDPPGVPAEWALSPEGLPLDSSSERYARRTVLGSGGMGQVWLVHDRAVGRDVAMKVIRPDRRRGRAGQRFLTEAQVQGRLEHPVIVPLYDVGRHEDGSIYFTMKRVRGESMKDVLARISRDPDSRATARTQRQLLGVMSQVCLAVEYAHERGVVHRDLKPSNIMLGDYGEVYVIDWGVAKVQGAVEPPRIEDSEPPLGSDGVTRTGETLGTPGYIAPEQVARGAGVADARSDIYSLGVILFELLALARMHSAKAHADRLVETVAGVDPRQRAQAVGRDVPPELMEVCVRATATDPDARFASARALHDAIERYLEGDRNLELRRELARSYGTAAARDAERLATENAPESTRTGALRAVGRALALDPDNRTALKTLVTLLTTRPQTTPPEVEEEVQEQRKGQVRRGALLAVFLYLYVSLNSVFTYSLGIKDWGLFLGPHIVWLGALAASVRTWRRPSYGGLLAVYVFGIAGSVFATVAYSPHFLVLGLLTVHAVVFSAMRGWRLRSVLMAVALVGWTLSAFGQHMGLFPPTFSFVDGGIFIESPVIELTEAPLMVYFYACGVGVLLLPPLVIGWLWESARDADIQLRLQAWQLRQLIPEEAQPGH